MKNIYRFFTGASMRSLLSERVHHGIYRLRLASKILLAVGHQIRILADFVQPIERAQLSVGNVAQNTTNDYSHRSTYKPFSSTGNSLKNRTLLSHRDLQQTFLLFVSNTTCTAKGFIMWGTRLGKRKSVALKCAPQNHIYACVYNFIDLIPQKWTKNLGIWRREMVFLYKCYNCSWLRYKGNVVTILLPQLSKFIRIFSFQIVFWLNLLSPKWHRKIYKNIRLMCWK